MKIITVVFVGLFLILLVASPAAAQLGYTIGSKVNLRANPSMKAKVLCRLDQNRTIEIIERLKDGWIRVRDITGRTGFVHSGMVSRTWVKVLKKEKTLCLMHGDSVFKEYKIALCPYNPLGDKSVTGDGGTPEGRFFLCQRLRNPGMAKYGARSMLIAYPNIEDGRRGLKNKLIDYATYKRIVLAIKNGKIPPQDTKLGGSIRIHGGGSGHDWTLGCVGMDDKDIIKVFDALPARARVEIYRSGAQDRLINSTSYLSARILKGIKQQLEKPAFYTSRACGVFNISYPMGDIPKKQAVCTDVVVRALRQADVDLQALVHEDILMHPARYKGLAKSPDFTIDHRRCRNLNAFLKHNSRNLPLKQKESFRPGDFVLMDTGIRNGTNFDHVGLCHAQKDQQGFPEVFNIWSLGLRTNVMDLLGNSYPETTGHFRLNHPFDYM